MEENIRVLGGRHFTSTEIMQVILFIDLIYMSNFLTLLQKTMYLSSSIPMLVIPAAMAAVNPESFP